MPLPPWDAKSGQPASRRLRGQVSTELLLIIGLILVLFIPVLITIYFKASEANEQLSSYQSSIALSRIAGMINSVGSLGKGAYVISEIYVPNNVNRLAFNPLGDGGEVVLAIRQGNESSEEVEVVKFPLEGSGLDHPHEGLYRFNISNQGDRVAVERLG